MKTLFATFAVVLWAAHLCLAAGAVNIKSPEARALLAKNSRIVLLDVRTPEEYRQAHLAGALLIPLGELQRRVAEIPRDRPLLVYCAVGSRSVSAANFLASAGYREIYQMADGVVGWYKNGFPLERGSTQGAAR